MKRYYYYGVIIHVEGICFASNRISNQIKVKCFQINIPRFVVDDIADISSSLSELLLLLFFNRDKQYEKGKKE